MRSSGCRIDHLKNGNFELTYFGNFQTGEQSQTLTIRHRKDLEYIHAEIEKVLKKCYKTSK